MFTDLATTREQRVDVALGELAHHHALAQSAARDRLSAAGTALAAGATREQVQASMGGVGIADVLALFARDIP